MSSKLQLDEDLWTWKISELMMNGTLLAFLGSSHVHIYNVTDVHRPSSVTHTLPQPSLIRLRRILTNSVAQKRNSNGFRFFWSCTRNLMKYITRNFRLQSERQVRETRCLNTFGRVASEVFWWKQKQQLAALTSCSCALFVWWVDRVNDWSKMLQKPNVVQL